MEEEAEEAGGQCAGEPRRWLGNPLTRVRKAFYSLGPSYLEGKFQSSLPAGGRQGARGGSCEAGVRAGQRVGGPFLRLVPAVCDIMAYAPSVIPKVAFITGRGAQYCGWPSLGICQRRKGQLLK